MKISSVIKRHPLIFLLGFLVILTSFVATLEDWVDCLICITLLVTPLLILRMDPNRTWYRVLAGLWLIAYVPLSIYLAWATGIDIGWSPDRSARIPGWFSPLLLTYWVTFFGSFLIAFLVIIGVVGLWRHWSNAASYGVVVLTASFILFLLSGLPLIFARILFLDEFPFGSETLMLFIAYVTRRVIEKLVHQQDF